MIKVKIGRLCNERSLDIVVLQGCDEHGVVKAALEKEPGLKEYQVLSKGGLFTLVKSRDCKMYRFEGGGRKIPQAMAVKAKVSLREYLVVNVDLPWDKKGFS